jgi:hypothetical protein
MINVLSQCDFRMSEKEKKRQLGMPIGTAAARLRKQILFHLLIKLNENVCFKCGEKILDVSELSIEHKINWLHSKNPKEIFFNIENIAFSHLKCNRNERRGSGGRLRRINVGDEKSYCSKCGSIKDKKEFHANNNRWNGVAGHCKKCVSIYNKGRKRY